VFVRLWALPQSGTELVIFAGPTVTTINEEKQIDYAMLRRKAAATVFAVVLEPWRGVPRSEDQVDRTSPGDGRREACRRDRGLRRDAHTQRRQGAGIPGQLFRRQENRREDRHQCQRRLLDDGMNGKP